MKPIPQIIGEAIAVYGSLHQSSPNATGIGIIPATSLGV